MPTPPLVTVAVPSFQQGRFLADALDSILSQHVSVEIFLADGGSTDQTPEIIKKYAPHLAGWRSERDGGQANAINWAMAQGTAPFVCWLNSDDAFAANGLSTLLDALQKNSDWAMAYGKVMNTDATLTPTSAVWVQSFSRSKMAQRCIISQPGTLMRRTAWEAVGGVNGALHMAMDYDLWWKLSTQGPLGHVPRLVAYNRVHPETKTNSKRVQHYVEAMKVVRQHYGHVPLKWWLYWPYAVWFKSLLNPQR
ncbi:MAG: glycosyltransferase [Alphaproteobacteria bacterium]|nr:glycosyltransferase [Alphaproteobacteria bacterium]NDC55534.1 glycosyltransferase [Alphaproteobacteria bacterium]NDG03790.1 glycosyltransferase [Alphaproteobacteria bacterium]